MMTWWIHLASVWIPQDSPESNQELSQHPQTLNPWTPTRLFHPSMKIVVRTTILLAALPSSYGRKQRGHARICLWKPPQWQQHTRRSRNGSLILISPPARGSGLVGKTHTWKNKIASACIRDQTSGPLSAIHTKIRIDWFALSGRISVAWDHCSFHL